MAFFRSARREPPPATLAKSAAAAGPALGPAPAPAPRRTSAPAPPPLAATLREIADAAFAPEDALEPALQAIVEATNLSAGAVCLYDPRRELLRLAAETGFSDEGCRKLRNVRRSDPVTWDMPLQGLLNRRVYLIDNAAQNRYVPPLVDQAHAMRTIACLPLLSGTAPLGSLVLVAVGTQLITEHTIRSLQDALRELARMIEAVRRRVAAQPTPAAPTPSPQTPLPAGRTLHPPAATAPDAPGQPSGALAAAEATAAAEARAAQHAAALEALRSELTAQALAHQQEVQALAARLEEAELAATRAERRRLEVEASAESQTTAADADLDHARAAARAAETARDAATADAAAARTALAEAETARDHERDDRTRLAGEVEQLAAEIRAAQLERHRLETALREATARAEATADARASREPELVAEIERLRIHLTEAESAAARERARREALESAGCETNPEVQAALERAQDDAWRAEEARAATAAEAAAIQAALAERESQLGRVTTELDQTRGLLAGLEANLRETQADRERLEHEHAASRARLDQLDADIAALRDDQAAATAREERLQAALSAADAERERLEESQEALRASEREATHHAADAEAELAALQEAAARHTAQLAARETRQAELEARHASLEAERSALGERHLELEARNRRLEEQCRAAQDQLRVREEERDAFQEQARVLSEQNRALVARVDELREAFQLVESVPVEAPALDETAVTPTPESEPPAEPVAAPPTSPPEPERPSARVLSLVAARGAAPARPAAAEPRVEAGPKLVAVLDSHLAWEALTAGDRRVVVVSPETDVAARLAELHPTRLVANLAAPGVFDAIVGLREAGSTLRVWACIGAPGTGRSIRLGMIETTTRPLDPDAVLALLANYAVRGTRVFTAGADADALISLRQALSRQGMSVSIAWDAKQATDMLGVVRPEAAVIDLELPPRDGFAVVAQLGMLSSPPNLVLVTGSEDIASGFTAALGDRSCAALGLPLDGVVTDVLARSEAPPVERR